VARLERDGVAAFDVDDEPAVHDEEELVLVVVLVPVEVALDDAEADDGVVDARQRLVEPRLVRGGLGADVDELEGAELLVDLDVLVALRAHARSDRRVRHPTGAARSAEPLPSRAMPARVRMALFVTALLAMTAALGVALFDRPGTPSTSVAFAGALRPEIPPQDVRLHDQDGRPVSLRQFRGRVVILTFMYTTCRDTCPLTATQIRGALDDLGRPVPALAVSVDPVNDTPERARSFLFQRGLAHDRMRFLLGSRAQLRPIWKAYGIQPQGNAFDHTAYVLLIDRRGRQRIGFPVQQLVPEDLAHDVRRLQAET